MYGWQLANTSGRVDNDPMVLDRTSGVPVFRQVAADLRSKITAGEFAPGTRLPSERDLVETYGISRPTVRDAVQLLQNEGIVTAEHGRGVFVNPPHRVRRLTRTRRAGENTADPTLEAEIHIRFDVSDAHAAQYLAILEGVELTVRDQTYRTNGRIEQIAVSRLTRDIAKDTPLEVAGAGDTYTYLEDAGHRVERFAEHVTARMPTPDEASIFQLAGGVPVFVVTRVAYDGEGEPLEMNDITLPADRHHLTYEWPAD